MLRNLSFFLPPVLAFSLFAFCDQPDASPYQNWCEQNLRADSGFVSSAQTAALQRLICQHDSAVFTDEYRPVLLQMLDSSQVAPNDSAGKFYRLRFPDGDFHYVLYLPINLLFAEGLLVLDFREQKTGFSFGGYEWFFHGNHSCCLNNDWSEFSRLGPYLYIETCGTGTGFCSGQINFLTFPLVHNDDNDYEAPSVIVQWWQYFLLAEQLDGGLHMAGDTIVADYTYHADTLLEDAAGEMIPHPVYDSRFTALYHLDTANRSIRLLNRDAVLQEKRLDYLFDAD